MCMNRKTMTSINSGELSNYFRVVWKKKFICDNVSLWLFCLVKKWMGFGDGEHQSTLHESDLSDRSNHTGHTERRFSYALMVWFEIAGYQWPRGWWGHSKGNGKYSCVDSEWNSGGYSIKSDFVGWIFTGWSVSRTRGTHLHTIVGRSDGIIVLVNPAQNVSGWKEMSGHCARKKTYIFLITVFELHDFFINVFCYLVFRFSKLMVIVIPLSSIRLVSCLPVCWKLLWKTHNLLRTGECRIHRLTRNWST